MDHTATITALVAAVVDASSVAGDEVHAAWMPGLPAVAVVGDQCDTDAVSAHQSMQRRAAEERIARALEAAATAHAGEGCPFADLRLTLFHHPNADAPSLTVHADWLTMEGNIHGTFAHLGNEIAVMRAEDAAAGGMVPTAYAISCPTGNGRNVKVVIRAVDAASALIRLLRTTYKPNGLAVVTDIEPLAVDPYAAVAEAQRRLGLSLQINPDSLCFSVAGALRFIPERR